MENELKVINQGGKLLTDSRDVATMVGKEHSKLLRDINIYIGYLAEGETSNFFIESTYKDKNNQERKCYKITIDGIKMIIDKSRKTKKLQLLIEWYNNNSTQETQIILANRFEDEFMNKLEQALEPMELILEKQFIVDNYRLDGYIPSLKLAIEYDEGQHKISTNKKLDKIRQDYISKKLGCTFIRCDYEDTDAYNIGKVFKKIMEVK
ncbi:antirepressor protein (plasmid) [Clostridium botulinum]|uniref:Antirepressor protein n=1 Tax=Clostridium botulinum TaxID=1491 RepID=A0A9Q1ZAN6_CLOBO|nr:Rha family transcriptional regulator [Clostridium botulinum]AEB77394.1 putative antirepressor protein [Clostridium botulinum BKT015925]KEH96381.1 antirepressor protein [Clostridium botulinum C/D str. Sp77]KLU74486.1 putative antirepressor protein [Clostridium botulinum V891]KOA75519.1 antirepressor protein [Clostridium botulinum]KOA77634.1 antirepressor protein [Clostridium botulinum]